MKHFGIAINDNDKDSLTTDCCNDDDDEPAAISKYHQQVIAKARL